MLLTAAGPFGKLLGTELFAQSVFDIAKPLEQAERLQHQHVGADAHVGITTFNTIERGPARAGTFGD